MGSGHLIPHAPAPRSLVAPARKPGWGGAGLHAAPTSRKRGHAQKGEGRHAPSHSRTAPHPFLAAPSQSRAPTVCARLGAQKRGVCTPSRSHVNPHLPPPPAPPLRATVCAETVARRGRRTSRLVCAPPRPSVPRKVGAKGGTHPTPRSRARTPAAYPLPIPHPFARRSCAQSRGEGKGGAAPGLRAPFARKRGQAAKGGASRAVPRSRKRVQGTGKRGGYPARTRARVLFAR